MNFRGKDLRILHTTPEQLAQALLRSGAEPRPETREIEDLYMVKLQMKASGGFRTVAGSIASPKCGPITLLAGQGNSYDT